MVTTAWYRKIFWLVKREFPRWLVNWNYVWTAGKIILGEKFDFCLATDLCAIMADETEISYNDHDFCELLSDYYREANEEPFETVNKLYRLRLLLQAAEKNESPEKVRAGLEGLIENTEHIICQSFLIGALADHYEKNKFKDEALSLLATIPHERRRSFAFLKKIYVPEYGVNEADYFYACLEHITHPVERELAFEIEYERLARSGRWAEAYQSFTRSLNSRSLSFDYRHFIEILLHAGEKVVIDKVLNLYLERLEKDRAGESGSASFEIFVNDLREKGFESYADEINRIVR